MKKIVLILLLLPLLSNSQTYLAPITGLQNTFAGACMVNTCSGTYYDDGGALNNYSNNIGTPGFGGIYRTFCPTSKGQCVRATINYIDIEPAFPGCYDYLILIDGATQNNPQTGNYCGTINPWNATFTSTDSSGCIGVRFYSDFITTQAGWQITLSCVPGCGDLLNDQDCSTNTPVCVNTPISSTSGGPGLVSTCGDCIVAENYSTWYHVIINTGGTWEMTINPTNSTDDYDFAVFQSNNCAALGNPVRCSYAAGAATGFAAGQTGTTEDVLGDSWLAPITGVSPGDEFFIMVNDWSGTGTGYTLSWGGSASLDCVVLPVELLNFEGRAYDDFIELNWNVATELSLERYDIEKLVNGEWTKILETQPVGDNSFYAITDIYPKRGANIYRLKSIDLNGEYSYSDAISVNFNKEIFDVIITTNEVKINATDVPINSIELFNVLGQEINNLPLKILNEGEKYILDLDQLPNNSYILRLNSIESRLFVKYY